jgi:transposase-like protein
MAKDRNEPVSDEVILRAVVAASTADQTIADVAVATGMKITSLNQRLQSLRKGGLKLPALKRRPTSGEKRRKDYGSLTTLLTQIQSEAESAQS